MNDLGTTITVKEDKLDRTELIINLLLAGNTLQQIGDKLKLSRERVRQIAKLGGVSPGEIRRNHLAEKKKNAREVLIKQRLDLGLKCAVCNQPVTRYSTNNRKHVTCSHKCAIAWPILRYQIDNEFRTYRRLATAKWVIKNPEKCTQSQIRHAERVLSGRLPTGPKAGMRYTLQGSKSDQLRIITHKKIPPPIGS